MWRKFSRRIKSGFFDENFQTKIFGRVFFATNIFDVKVCSFIKSIETRKFPEARRWDLSTMTLKFLNSLLRWGQKTTILKLVQAMNTQYPPKLEGVFVIQFGSPWVNLTRWSRVLRNTAASQPLSRRVCAIGPWATEFIFKSWVYLEWMK